LSETYGTFVEGRISQVSRSETVRGKEPGADNRERRTTFCAAGKTGKMATASTERIESARTMI